MYPILFYVFLLIITQSHNSKTLESNNNNKCKVYTSIEQLRSAKGDNSQSYLYGLNDQETRQLYHDLLPSCLLDDDGDICQRAHKAYLGRKVAKLYTRERGNVIVSTFSKLFDASRTLWKEWKWNTEGINELELWNRKVRQLNLHDECYVDANELEEMAFQKGLNYGDNFENFQPNDISVNNLKSESTLYNLYNTNKCANVCDQILKSSLNTNEFVDIIARVDPTQDKTKDL